MIRIGIAGIGFMGVTHFKAAAELPGVEVAAMFTRSQKKLAGDWSDVKGNFGGSGGQHDLSGIARYHSYNELISDKRLDLIDICLPSPMHPAASIAAVQAGKHVLVEKPVALTVADADRMIEAADAAGRQLMVAQVLRFWPHWAFLKHAIEDGRFGPLVSLNLRRVISMPDWSDAIADMSANGGPLIDLHIHDVDFLLYLLGKPLRVAATGQQREGYVLFISSLYDYGRDGPTVSCQSGAVAMPGRPFIHQYEACFKAATVTFGRATEPDDNDPSAGQSQSHVLMVYDENGSVEYPTFDHPEGFAPQFEHVAACIESGKPSPIIAARYARDALAVVQLEAQAINEGAFVQVS